jgi:NADPH:quinone reductase-like Zn-dependent oxidoreductase
VENPLKAVYLNSHGALDVLEYGELDSPTPEQGEVQVRLHAAALNRADLWTRAGWPGLKIKYPHILGTDGAGVVSALGNGVSEFELGGRVVINANIGCGHCNICLSGKDNLCRDWHLLGETLPGTYAEYVVVPAKNLLAIPNDFDFKVAAAASLVYLTAWHSLVTRGHLQPDELVLVVGASGGVNTASIQIAKYIGATVYVVGSTGEKLGLAESLGADFLIDRSKEDNWSKAVYKLTNKMGVDVVVDNVGAETMPLSLRAARKGGRILTVGNTSGPKFEIDNRFVFGKHLSILGSTMGTMCDFEQVMELVFNGQLSPVLDRDFPLEDAVRAQQRLESGKQMGKITLET